MANLSMVLRDDTSTFKVIFVNLSIIVSQLETCLFTEDVA